MGGRTKTTRVGNGAGWGGPKRGEGHRYRAGENLHAGAPGVAKGDGKRRQIAALLEERGARELITRRWIDILNDPDHPHHATMIEKAANRLDGAPVQPTDITSNGQLIGYVIAAPVEAEDAEAWTEQHRPH